MYALTRHAEKRWQQRGFKDKVINLILNYGKIHPARGGASKVVFGEKECQKLLNDMDKMKKDAIKAKNKYLIIKEEKVITMAHILHRV